MQKVVFTIFGSTGDLCYRKLMPAFYNLFRRGLVERDVLFLALGRRHWNKETYIEQIKPWIKEFSRFEFTETSFNEFCQHIDYFEIQFTDAADYKNLSQYYSTISWLQDPEAMQIFYLAVAPRYFSTISENLIQHTCLGKENRVIIEKPFGPDLDTARTITNNLEAAFGAGHVYHIDHYLGKDMVQNLYNIRWQNPVIKNLWNNKNIKSIQINALESIDIGRRGEFYDAAGTIQDMLQSHLFQVLTLLTMPAEYEPGSSQFHQAQTEILASLRQFSDLSANDFKSVLALGQYEGYLAADKVKPDSRTETFAALKLFIDNELWQGVPIYLRSGKALEKKSTYVTVVFNSQNNLGADNLIRITIDPEAQICLNTFLAAPTLSSNLDIEEIKLGFSRHDFADQATHIPEAYERLFYACYLGQKEYFAQWESIEIIWKHIIALQARKQLLNYQPEIYTKGSRGPCSQDKILEPGDKWY